MTDFEVLVAVGPEGIHDGALDLAVSEARRRDTGVLLLHVVQGAGSVQSLDHALTEVGRSVLTDAFTRIGDRVPCTSEMVTGPIASTIVERAASGGLVVLERRDAGTVERLLTMSVSTRVAAHAPTSVVVVPADWKPRPDLPVTVGVDRPQDAIGQVRPAIDHARASGSDLVVLHAAWLNEPYQDLVFGNDTRERWLHEAERELDQALSALPQSDDLTVDVVWRPPVDALVGATRLSSVVVLNRRPDRAFTPHLGAITRAVLRHAEGPVLIVDRT